MPLSALLRPRSVAVVGASREPGKVGHVILTNLLAGGFAGDLYAVNPSASEVLGVRSYPSLTQLPETVDLAVIAVPARAVPGVMSECQEAGVGAVAVISAGFTESGPGGAALQREVLDIAKRSGIRLLGPNCLGLISTHHRLNAAFAGEMPPPGGISFVSQSGALGTAIVDRSLDDGLGIAHFVSVGNRADIAEHDLLAAFREDDSTTVIALYIESVGDGTAFLDAAAAASAVKPVIAIKAGASDSGARAVSSHTGSLAGSDVAYDAAFRWAGVIRARSVQELFDYAAAFSLQPVPPGPGVAILTNAGGPAVMATDAAEREGLAMASFESDTLATLRAVLPEAAALYNPVDVLGDAGPGRYRAALESLYADPGTGSVIVILTPQAMTDADAIAQTVVETAAAHPGVTTLTSFMGGPRVEKARSVLAKGSIPDYPTPERAIRSLAAMYSYQTSRSDPPRRSDGPSGDDRRVVRDVLRAASGQHRTFVSEESGAAIVRAYGIRTPSGKLVTDRESALAAAEEIGYPVVLKIASPEILHKSDIGGIRTGLASPEQLARAYDEILGRAKTYAPDAPIDGIHVQQMVPEGREVIVGVDRDPVFGPLLMFGLGGVYVEVLRDVTFRLCPVDAKEADRMISEVRAFGLLRGARGESPADLPAVARAIESVSALVLDFPEILELDINPLIVGSIGEGVWAADVRIGIGGT